MSLLVTATAAGEELTPALALRQFDKTNSRGLPQSTVISMAQDESGRLWLATLDGLGVFDGTSIETVSPVADAPAFGALNVVISRRGGGVFVGGRTGVFVFDGKTWSHRSSQRAVLSLAQAANGTLFMADVEGALWWIEPGAAEWHRRSEIQKPATLVVGTPDGSVLVASRDAVVRLSAGAIEPVAGGAKLAAPPGAILGTRDKRIWVATNEGTLLWAEPQSSSWNTASIPGLREARFRSLAEGRRGRVWAGTFDGRVAYGVAEGPFRLLSTDNGLTGAGVMAILGDREGSLWFGLNGLGVQNLVGEAWSHRRWPRSDSSTFASRLPVFGLSKTHDGGLLIAAFNRGLLRASRDRVESFGRAQGLVEDTRHAVEPEPGRIWVGARFGIFESRNAANFRKVLDVPAGFVTGLYQSPERTWYAATSARGLYVFEGNTWRPDVRHNEKLPDPYVRGVTWLSNGEMWVSTLRGVAVFRGEENETLDASRIAAMPESANAVLESRLDEVWVAGIGGIALRVAGAWRRMGVGEGIPGRTIYSLVKANDGSIWAGGSAGVGRYKDGHWTRWDSRTGLIEEECNLNGLLAAADGSIYVGTMASLARFDPGVEPLPSPPLRLLWVEAPARALDGVARLAAGKRSLRLRWTAPWLDPRPVEYRTRVSRLSPDWSAPTFEDRLAIENLTAGKWDVHVQARVEGRSEWSEPLTLTVLVEPRFVETPAAAGLLFVASGLGMFAFVRLRTAQLRRRQAELQRAVDEAVARVKVLSGLLPICASCKKVRDDKGYWNQIESYISARSQAEFSHGICPDCFAQIYPGRTYRGETPVP